MPNPNMFEWAFLAYIWEVQGKWLLNFCILVSFATTFQHVLVLTENHSDSNRLLSIMANLADKGILVANLIGN